MEFIKGDKDKNNWTFYKTAIATSDVTLDDRIITQYKNINSPQAAADQQPPASSDGDVIKLFDDE
jgi:hypothetical protein